MANSLLTIGGITREAVRLFRNTNAFMQSIDRQYDDSFAVHGAKIGDQLRIRKPNDFVGRTGPTMSLNTVNELSTTLTMGTLKGVDVPFSSVDRTLSMDDYAERILSPMVNVLAGLIASDIMSGATPSNMTSNTVTPTNADWLMAGALLDTASGRRGDRKAVLDPYTQARTVSSMSGLFNPTGRISEQYDSGEMMGPALGIKDWMSDQTILKHTNGTATGVTISGASQTGLVLNMVATGAGTLAVGDIFTIAGVNSVNRVTKVSNQTLQQFTVTAVATLGAGAVGVSVYPALNPAVGGLPVQYQTVDVSPANGAAVTVLGGGFAGGYRRNLVLLPEAVTMVSADLYMPTKGVVEAARETFDNISIRIITDYDITSNQTFTRMDVLYGYLWVRPEWAVVVPDAI